MEFIDPGRPHRGLQLHRQGGNRTAIWVNANVLAGWGQITTINSAMMVLRPDQDSAQITRQLTIGSYTTTWIDQATKIGGGTGTLAVGDDIHWVATADDPSLTPITLWALTLHKVQLEDMA